MNIVQVVGSVEVGLIYGLVALGVYLSFRVLDFPDLTVDGSFPLGAAVSATLIVQGVDPVFATAAAMLAGACAGLVTALLATQLKVLNLLAGILTMTALYSINLRIMGRPNIALMGEDTLFNGENSGFLQFAMQSVEQYQALMIIVILMTLGMAWFLSTQSGLAIRATGVNARMARSQGIKDHWMIWMGLSISNALVALAGSLFAQYSQFADATMGVGTIIIGLAAVILGEVLAPKRVVVHLIIMIFGAPMLYFLMDGPSWEIMILIGTLLGGVAVLAAAEWLPFTRIIILGLYACLVGAVLYRFAIAMALFSSDIGLPASDLNLVTAVLVAVSLVFPSFKARWKKKVSA